MKKLSKMFKMIVTSILIITGIVSCNKSDLDVKPQETVQNYAAVSSNKLGFLEFKDVETFQQTVSKLKSLSQDERIAWEKEYNFTSLKSIHEEVLRGEEELFKNLKITFKDVTKVNVSDFPATHSESFEKHKNSIVSTGERIINTPSMNVGFSEYATVINSEGYVKIGKALFQFEKGLIKISTIDEVKPNDLITINETVKSTSTIKILASNISSSNMKISSFSGTLLAPPAALANRIMFGKVDYQDTYRFANPSEPGAFSINLTGLTFWLAPIVSVKTSMEVHRSYWYTGGYSLESNCPVGLDGNVITNGYQFGQTNGSGVFEHDSYVYGWGSFALPIVNVGFLFPNSAGGYSQVTRIFQYL